MKNHEYRDHFDFIDGAREHCEMTIRNHPAGKWMDGALNRLLECAEAAKKILGSPGAIRQSVQNELLRVYVANQDAVNALWGNQSPTTTCVEATILWMVERILAESEENRTSDNS